MASVDPIHISSSDSSEADSDLKEIENYRDESLVRYNRDESPVKDTASSSNSRRLPSWASRANSSLTGFNGLPRKEPSLPPLPSKRQTVHDEISSRPDKRLSTVQTGASTSRMDGNFSQTVGSIYSDRHGTGLKMHSSPQLMKRALPASFQPLASIKQYNNLIEKVGARKIHETYGESYQPSTRSNNPNGASSTKENFILGSGNAFTLHGNKGNRILPPSLSYGKNSSLPQFNSASNSFYDPRLGEEGAAGADERFVFQAAVQDLHQPNVEAALPEGLLSVSLLRHQKIALAWMLNKESSGFCLGGILADDQGLGKTVSTIALILMQRHLEAKARSKDSCDTRTEALNLDDDGSDGCVALDDATQIKESDEYTILPEAGTMLKGFHSKRPTAGTLIVCPASVLRQWDRELREKVTHEAKLSVLIYHGGNRTKDPAILAQHDTVLTTYAIVTNEVPKQPLIEEDGDEQKDGEQYGSSSVYSMGNKRKKSTYSKKFKKGKREIDMSNFDRNCGTLARVKWSRVVLDESQTIKNHRTQVARACCSLRAKRRWCLSGTPIQNSIDELFSYFRFLRYDPYDKYKLFVSSIKSMISRDSVKGFQKLQVVLRNIMLRRSKDTMIGGKPIITLPPKKIHLTKVEFSSEERAFYDKLEADSRKQFKAYAAAGTVHQNYANILLMLLRLRQACDHPVLVKGLISDSVGEVSCEMAKLLPRELLVNLWRKLETSSAICLVCRDPPENAVVTMCGHVFCYQCVSDHLTGEENTCPAPECKEQLGVDVVYSRATLGRCISDDIGSDFPVSYEPNEKTIVLRSDYISSKIKSALEILKAHCISKIQNSESCDMITYDEDVSFSDGLNLDAASGGKVIVFSQWTTMLDLMEVSLKNSHLSYRRLDGTMSIAARDKAVKDFHIDPEVDVMLMSLKAGNLGLNMVVACRVILLDLWWNPTTEDQAIDRAHRIGQTRPVTVSRLTIENTVEDRILALQEEKRKLVASAFGEDRSSGRGTGLTLEDLRFLFEGSQASRP